MPTTSTFNKIVIGTLAQVAQQTLDPDSLYQITDYPVGGITNAQMATALTPTYNAFFMTGDVFVCSDSGTYLKGRAYRFTGTGWAEVTEFDTAPTQSSVKPVTSGGVYTALTAKQDTLTFDSAPTNNSDNPVKSGGVYTALSGKQDTLTFDQTPTQNSTNPVTSGGVYSYVASTVGDINTVLESLL